MNLTKENIEDIYPASYLQAGMLLESSLNNTGTYHDVFFYKIAGEFDCIFFMHIWDQLIAKHELLRSRFISDKNGWVNVIEKSVFKICSVYYAEDLEQIINTEKLNNIDYEKPGLFRLIINDLPDNQFYLIFSFHHAIADGWSVASLINEFIQAYSYNKPILNNINLYYGEFVRNEQLAIKVPSNTEFWTDYLSNIEIPGKIRWNFKQKISPNNIFKSKLKLNSTYCKQIHKIAQANKVSVDSIFLYAYIKTLAQFLNQDDITIGLVVNNRLEKEGGDKLFGLFLNTIPYRLNLKSIKNNVEGISKSYVEKVKLYEYKLVPYGHIKSIFKNDLFQFAFNFVNFHVLNDSAHAIVNSGGYERTNIPFALSVIQNSNQSFSLNLIVHDNIADQDYLNYFTKYLKHNLKHVIWDQSGYAGLLPEDYQKMIYAWNKTDKKYPQNKTVHQLFEEQVAKTPNNIALVYKDMKLTYTELNQRSNQLAHYLRNKHQVKADNLIALCLDRNEYMIIAILAVLKSGAAYVPIDPNYPNERINYILKDTSTSVILSSSIHKKNLIDIINNINILTPKITLDLIDTKIFNRNLCKFVTNNLIVNITHTNLAYVIYTSGTTGIPKGVLINHIGLVNLVNMYNSEIADANVSNKIDRYLWYSSYVFDAHVWSMFPPLTHGHALYVATDEMRTDIRLLKQYMSHNKINIATIPPSFLTTDNVLELKTLILAGEIANNHIFKVYHKLGTKIINAYGPTEITVCSHIHRYTSKSSNINIGKPIQNTKSYILNSNLAPLPIGVTGDLYITGDGLTKGYLNHPSLTQEKFVANLFQTKIESQYNKNSLLYNTGDIARYLPNGDLEYLGRNDSQVKMRGFRIELGEIESILCNYAGITQSVVVIRKHTSNSVTAIKDSYLIGYYVAKKKLDEIAILNYLSDKLPTHMIPSILCWIDKVPLTINGKLDINALPKASFTTNTNYVAPRNELEIIVCTIFAEVLGLANDKIGVNDDFFRLGGDSISATRLLYKLQQKFKININDLFKLRTPSKITQLITFDTNNLQHKLKQIRFIYKKLSDYKKDYSNDMKIKILEYMKQTEEISFKQKPKTIRWVLLTGATGHLGVHLLYQLLLRTNYQIYLLIRATSNIDAYNRVANKFSYYFNANLDQYKNRIVAYKSNIEKSYLDLNIADYNELAINVDSIIHAAALTMHYGVYTTFYQANVQATINLLELSKITILKEFHYISTLSVLTNGHVPNYHHYVFTENDNYTKLQDGINIYSQTKHEGELVTLNYRKFGIMSNIYRVGNLAISAKYNCLQENINKNAFLINVKTILTLGTIPNEISHVEISPVDYTASAIVQLFNQSELNNQTYHIANPSKCNLLKLFTQDKNINLRVVTLNKFVNDILTRLNSADLDSNESLILHLFMLHHQWLEEIDLNKLTQITILQNKTDHILKKLGFNWPSITSTMFSGIINNISGTT